MVGVAVNNNALPRQILAVGADTVTEAAAVPFIMVSALLFAVAVLTQGRLLVITTVITSLLFKELLVQLAAFEPVLLPFFFH